MSRRLGLCLASITLSEAEGLPASLSHTESPPSSDDTATLYESRSLQHYHIATLSSLLPLRILSFRFAIYIIITSHY